MRRLLGIAILLAPLLGCGQGDAFSVAKVHGKITCCDGKPLSAASVRVWFMPQDAAPVGGKHARPSEGKLDADGSFSQLTTYRWGDGAIVARHRVVLAAYKADGTMDAMALPAKYRDPKTTPLEVDVRHDGPNRYELLVDR